MQNGNPNQDSIVKIAADFKVEAKTITRIHTGKTWADVKQEFESNLQPSVRVLGVQGLISEFGLTIQTKRVAINYQDEDDVIEWTERIRSTFLFQPSNPLAYGSYDWIDGVHSVATDGIIAWDDRALADFVQRLGETGIKRPPILAHQVREIPTGRLFAMFAKPIHRVFTSREPEDLGICLQTEEGWTAYIDMRYNAIIDKHGFDVCQAGDRTDFVYLTKKDKHGEHTIYACLATLKEQDHAKPN